MAQDIFFWIGHESSSDEYGTAAILALQLFRFFNEKPIQHREVEGFESKKFVELFGEQGVQYIKGGVASGFKHVTPNGPLPTKLFQVKGGSRSSLRCVPPTGASLNQGDTFVLQTSDTIFLWLGKNASPMEKLKAAKKAAELKVKVKDNLVRLEDGEVTPEFWAALGGAVPIAEDGGSDAEFAAQNILQLYVIKGPGSSVKVAEAGGVHRSMLKAPDVFVVRRGQNAVVWLPSGNKDPNPIETAVDAVLKPLGLDRNVALSVAKQDVKSEELDLLWN